MLDAGVYFFTGHVRPERQVDLCIPSYERKRPRVRGSQNEIYAAQKATCEAQKSQDKAVCEAARAALQARIAPEPAGDGRHKAGHDGWAAAPTSVARKRTTLSQLQFRREVTARELAWRYFSQGRRLSPAAFLGKQAAWVEIAAWRR